jgi:hypothetical protein
LRKEQVDEYSEPFTIGMMKILIIGTLGAGKTTLARALSQETGYPYASIDDCRIRYSDGTTDGEDAAWRSFLRACRDPSSGILEFSGGGPHVSEVRDALLSSGIAVSVIWIDISHDLCIERASKRENVIPAPFVWAPIEYSVVAIHSGIETAWERVWNAEPGFCARRMVFSRDTPSSEISLRVLSHLFRFGWKQPIRGGT